MVIISRSEGFVITISIIILYHKIKLEEGNLLPVVEKLWR